jgi:hypothetical protein
LRDIAALRCRKEARLARAANTQETTTMRTLSLIAIITASLSLSTIGANAATWCAHYGGYGGTNCGFHSFEQCQAALSGNGGFCSRG